MLQEGTLGEKVQGNHLKEVKKEIERLFQRRDLPVQVSARRPVARGEERTGSTTTMPMSARRPSTMNCYFPGEVPQSSMAKTTDIGASVR